MLRNGVAERAPAIAGGLVSVFLIAWVAFGASRGHFSGDDGVRFAQSVGLWRSGFTSKAMPDNPDIDPEHRWAPFPGFTANVRGERQGIYSLVFTALGAPWIAVFGMPGMVVLPLLGVILCITGVLMLTRRLELSSPVAAGTVGITVGLTPLLFYAGQYQEHTLAAGLVTTGVAWLTPDNRGARRPAVAGGLIGLAATMRPECYCALPAAALVAALQPGFPMRRVVRDTALLAGGSLGALVPNWGINSVVSGTWDPLVFHHRGKGFFPASAQAILVGPVEGTGWAVLAFIGCVVMCAALLRLHRWPAVPGATVRSVLGVAITGAGYWAFANQHDRVVLGFFAATPLVAFPLLAGPGAHRTGALWAFAITFIAQVSALEMTGVAGGLQIGARYLLPAMPVLLVTGAAMIDRDLRSPSPVVRRLAIALSAALIAISLHPAVVAYRKADVIARGGEEAAAHARAASGDVVVTRRWWESQILAPVMLDGKRLFFIEGDPTPLLAHLRDHGIREFAIADSDVRQRFALPRGAQAMTVRRWPGWLEIREMTINAPAAP